MAYKRMRAGEATPTGEMEALSPMATPGLEWVKSTSLYTRGSPARCSTTGHSDELLSGAAAEVQMRSTSLRAVRSSSASTSQRTPSQNVNGKFERSAIRPSPPCSLTSPIPRPRPSKSRDHVTSSSVSTSWNWSRHPSTDYASSALRISCLLMTAWRWCRSSTGRDSWRTRSRRRNYRSSTSASMTTYRIDEFWTAATECGLRPELITLVPKNALDERYAYFLLTKAG